jgi:cytoskeletal protein CcmA (bactofilin family)
MKTIVKKAIRNQKGSALPLVLVLLVVGGLILTPLLGLMSTGLASGQVYEKKTDELYAADAGVEDALWRIQSKDANICPGKTTQSFSISYVNGKQVDVVMQYLDIDGRTCYKITSAATTVSNGAASIDSGSRTTVQSYIDVEFAVGDLFNHAITSLGDVTVKSGSSVNGTVQYGGLLNNQGTINGDEIHERYEKWPTFLDLSAYYWDQVKDIEPYTNKQIPIAGGTTRNDPRVIGSLSATPDGGTLTVKGDGWVEFDGTVCVKGNLDFQPTSGVNIDLNNSTIFVEGGITMLPQVTLTGSGCIIAGGDITFQPAMQSSSSDFVFVMSIEGTVHFQPAHGTFYGSLAGDADVDLWGDTSLVWHPLGEGVDMNFPIDDYRYETDIVSIAKIRTWEISQQ